MRVDGVDGFNEVGKVAQHNTTNTHINSDFDVVEKLHNKMSEEV